MIRAFKEENCMYFNGSEPKRGKTWGVPKAAPSLAKKDSNCTT